MKNKKLLILTLIMACLSPLISQAESLRSIEDVRGKENHFADIAINYDGPLFDYIQLRNYDVPKRDNASLKEIPEEKTKSEDIKSYTKDQIYALNENTIIKELDDTRFVFDSGASGWWSELIFDKGGKFTGHYVDGDYNESVECTIEGKFVVDSKVNDTTYIIKLVDPVITSPSNRSYVRQEQDREVTNYYVDHFYGFAKDDLQNFSFQDKFTLYTPYRRYDEMSPEVNKWLRMNGDKAEGDSETSKFIIVNNSTIETFIQRPMSEKIDY